MRGLLALDVSLRDVLSTWPGRVYVGTLAVLVGVWYSASLQVATGASGAGVSTATSVLFFSDSSALVLSAWRLGRDQLRWAVTRTVVTAVVSFLLLVGSMIALGIRTTDALFRATTPRLLSSLTFGSVVAAVLTLCVLIVVVLVRGPGGSGPSPEEQVLGDDLDL